MLNRSNYKKIIDVRDTKSLASHFIFDNLLLDGSDPTGSAVDYSYGMSRDTDGAIIPNINGDISWGDIDISNEKTKELISDYDGGIRIGLSDDIIPDGRVGSVRLISRKLFKGGVFVFDIEHVPIGCGIWPAIWLNGFVGGTDQYHEPKGTDKYSSGIRKLAASTINENFSHVCNDVDQTLTNVKDPHLSDYAKRDVYVGMWPTGGEFDILEQTNFSNTNLVSIHGGPKCEVSTSNKANFYQPWLGDDYKQLGLRSVCGQTYDGFGPYSGCKADAYLANKGQTKLPNGTTRYNCPMQSAINAGNSQIVGPPGSFGEAFNGSRGGVYAVQWIPKKRLNVWWYPYAEYDRTNLGKSSGPLSNNPDPSTWSEKTLVAGYILDNNNAIHDGCDFNYQGIIINIAVGGGWGAGAVPTYCSVNNKTASSDFLNYLHTCYKADPHSADNNTDGGWDPDNGCYDGGKSASERGADAKPVFYSEAYFKIRNIKVFQNITDDNIW